MIVTVHPTRLSRPSRQPQPTRVCAFCGATTRPTGAVRAKANPDQPDACRAPACQTALAAWKRKHDPAYRERRREANQRASLARAAARQVPTDPYDERRGWKPCLGCGRRFPSGSLRDGRCGGWWCPVQQRDPGQPHAA